MFIWSLSSHSRIFHSYGDVTNAGEGLQILTYARHSWPLRNGGLLTCHCLRHGPTVYNGHLRGQATHLLPSVWQWSYHFLFLRLRSVVTGHRTPISRMRVERSNSTPPRRCNNHLTIWHQMIKNPICLAIVLKFILDLSACHKQALRIRLFVNNIDILDILILFHV